MSIPDIIASPQQRNYPLIMHIDKKPQLHYTPLCQNSKDNSRIYVRICLRLYYPKLCAMIMVMFQRWGKNEIYARYLRFWHTTKMHKTM